MTKLIFTSSALIVGMMLAAPATALVITPVFDQSITSMANSSAIQAAFIAVAKDYAQSFSSSANVRIGVSWGSVGGQVLPSNAVGASLNNLYTIIPIARSRRCYRGSRQPIRGTSR